MLEFQWCQHVESKNLCIINDSAEVLKLNCLTQVITELLKRIFMVMSWIFF